MKIKRKTILACTIYLVLIFIFAFFLSSIKNHYYVLGLGYVGAEYIKFADYISIYLPTFWREYYKNFLLFLPLLILINCIFVSTIIYMTGKRAFNGIVSIVLCSSIWGWMLFYINRESSLLPVFMFGSLLLFVIIMEFIFGLKNKNKLSFIYPFIVGILINMYYGIFILSTPYKISNFVPLLVAVTILYVIRCLLSFLNSKYRKKKFLTFVIAVVIFTLVVIILGLAWFDYSVGDPHKKTWQQLYYVAVYSSFFGTYIMQYLSKVLFIWKGNEEDIESKRKLNLIINSILLFIIPILCVFAVHGIILITLNGVVLLGNYFWILKKPFELNMIESRIHFLMAISLMVVTYFYMAIDPIIYLDASEHISMIWPLLLFLGVTCGAGSVYEILKKFLNEKSVYLFHRFMEKAKTSFDIKIQALLCFANLIVLAVFCFIYYLKDYANQSRSNLDVEFIDQNLEGFGGLYLLSWCMIPVFFNVSALLISIIYSLSKYHLEDSIKIENSGKDKNVS